MPLEVVINFNNIPQVEPKARAGAAMALNRAVMSTISYADPLTPVDTGALKGNKTITNASAGSLTAGVSWNQEYAIYQELGTVRGITPKLFATTGSERSKPGLITDMTAVGGKLA